jgi:hypothetical protein
MKFVQFVLFALVFVSSAFVSPAVAGSKGKTPIWDITVNGKPVKWAPWKPNPRFAVLDPDQDSDPADASTWTDDMVLDRETGLLWARNPSTVTAQPWGTALFRCFQSAALLRKGWRAATIEELGSLVDTSGATVGLSPGHPFYAPGTYWSSTSHPDNAANAFVLDANDGSVLNYPKVNTYRYWCVRGGIGNVPAH